MGVATIAMPLSPRPVRCLVAGSGQEDRDVFGSGVREGGEEQGEQAGLQCRQLPPRGTVEHRSIYIVA